MLITNLFNLARGGITSWVLLTLLILLLLSAVALILVWLVVLPF